MPPTHLIPLRARNTAVSDASPTNALHHSSACPHHLPSRDSIFPIVSPNFGETRRDVRCRPRGNSSSNLYLRFAASSVIFHFCHPEEAKSLACERLPTKDLCICSENGPPKCRPIALTERLFRILPQQRRAKVPAWMP